jgi:hypothetical protein
MKNTLTIPEAKIAICEKFLKDMNKLKQMELNDSKAQDKMEYCMSQVEKMMALFSNTGA